MIVDVNVNLSRWPFRRLPGDEPAALVAKLRQRGVGQAWAGTFDGVFHKDVSSANARLVEDCRKYGPGLLRPFGSVNPKLPDWKEDLRRCVEQHRMAGIRLHPNYHGYKLDDPDFRELLHLAAEKGIVVQLAVYLEDPRTQHPLMRVPRVNTAPLGEAVAAEPKLKLVLLNGGPPAEKQRAALARSEVYYDFAAVEQVGGVARLVELVGLSRVLFGTHYPFFQYESALLKVQESGLPEAQKKAIFEDNARRLLPR